MKKRKDLLNAYLDGLKNGFFLGVFTVSTSETINSNLWKDQQLLTSQRFNGLHQLHRKTRTKLLANARKPYGHRNGSSFCKYLHG